MAINLFPLISVDLHAGLFDSHDIRSKPMWESVCWFFDHMKHMDDYGDNDCVILFLEGSTNVLMISCNVCIACTKINF